MRIVVRDSNTNINLLFPTRIICSKIGVRLMSKHLAEKSGKMSYEQIGAMAKELCRFGKKHRGWVLAEVESKDGRVLIKL